MRGKTKILTVTIFAAVLSLVGSSKPANAATITSAKTENGSLIVTFGADYPVVEGTAVDEYLNELPGLKNYLHLIYKDKVLVEEDVATNSVKFTIENDAIKGSATVDGADADGLRRAVIFDDATKKETIRIQIHFARNEDGTWDYSKNVVDFLNKAEFKKEKQIEEKRKEVDALYETAKASQKPEDLEKAKAAEAALPGDARDVAYWNTITAKVEAVNAPAPAPAPTTTTTVATEIKKESAPVEEKKAEIQAPNTGIEGVEGGIFYLALAGISLLGATYFAIKKA